MESRRPREITGVEGYFWHTKLRNPERMPIEPEHCQTLINDPSIAERQSDGTWRFRGYSEELGFELIVIINEQGGLVNAFDPDYKEGT